LCNLYILVTIDTCPPGYVHGGGIGAI